VEATRFKQSIAGNRYVAGVQMLKRHVGRVGKAEGVKQFLMAYDPEKSRLIFVPPITYASQDSSAGMQMMTVEVLADQIGLRNNVIIEEKDDLALANRDTRVSRRCSSRFFLLRALPVRKPSAESAQQLGSFVATVVVYHHNFKILDRNALRNQALQRPLQFCRAIPCRNDD